MLLFPYAKDVEYINGELSFVLQLLNKEQETQISVKMQTSPELSEVLEKLLEFDGDVWYVMFAKILPNMCLKVKFQTIIKHY